MASLGSINPNEIRPHLPTTSPRLVEPQKHTAFLWIVVTFLLLGVSGFLAYQNWQLRQMINAPTSYQECVDAPGSLIQESYPATCVTKAGARFTQPLNDEEKQKRILPSDSPSMKACTLEAKLCPDGSSVGR